MTNKPTSYSSAVRQSTSHWAKLSEFCRVNGLRFHAEPFGNRRECEMLTAQLMKSMDADHLVASARAEIDPLTSTPLELELLDLAAKFRALASDAGDFFTRLNDLVSTNQE